ncbi:hypothetical protein TcWFU_004569 [Taenia crassiceps]|uniref:Glutathione transferase n=1 Tax=Taenia crassiceps TaxID=6207 RepID=A0ABR4Q6I7_9CEST
MTQSSAILGYIADRHGVGETDARSPGNPCAKVTNFETFLVDNINYLDFSLREVLIELIKLEPTCLNNYPKFQAYLCSELLGQMGVRSRPDLFVEMSLLRLVILSCLRWVYVVWRGFTSMRLATSTLLAVFHFHSVIFWPWRAELLHAVI